MSFGMAFDDVRKAMSSRMADSSLTTAESGSATKTSCTRKGDRRVSLLREGQEIQRLDLGRGRVAEVLLHDGVGVGILEREHATIYQRRVSNQ